MSPSVLINYPLIGSYVIYDPKESNLECSKIQLVAYVGMNI